MKKIILSFLLLLGFSTTYANQKYLHDFLGELKFSYFHFQDNTARNIYNEGGFMPSVEFDYTIYQPLHAFLEVGFLYTDGKSQVTNADTDITLIPVTLGIKPYYSVTQNTKLYVKFGPNWYWVRTTQDYAPMKRTVTKNGFGVTFGIGALLYVHKNWTLDFFTNYLYDKKVITDSSSGLSFTRYLGGFQIGAGAGYRF